jgi:hypothetical protein
VAATHPAFPVAANSAKIGVERVRHVGFRRRYQRFIHCLTFARFKGEI